MSKYKNVLIITSGLISVDRPPPGAAFIAGVCEHNNINYNFLDFNIFFRNNVNPELTEKIYVARSEKDLENLELANPGALFELDNVLNLMVEKIKSYQPDLIAATVFSVMQHLLAKRLFEKIKTSLDIEIIVGGPGVSAGYGNKSLVGQEKNGRSFGKFLLQNNLVDYYVMGEGDVVLDEFFKGNFVLGLNDKTTDYETWAPQIDNLDFLALPSYDKINFEDYVNPGNPTRTVTITASRGCVRRCTFCDVGAIWKKFRFRSGKNVVKEIVQNYQKHKVTDYFFSDSLLNGSLKQLNDLTAGLVELQNTVPGLEKIKYSGQFIIRPKAQHPEKMFKLLKESGCKQIQIGIESGSERVREHLGKKFSNEDIDWHLEMCSKYKIENFLLMFTGYPTETLQDHRDTLDMLARYQKYLIDDTIIGISLDSPLVILPDTPLSNMSTELGIHLYNNEYGNLWTSDANPELTIKERFLRYAETTKLVMKLRYNRFPTTLTTMEYQIHDLLKLNKKEFENEY